MIDKPLTREEVISVIEGRGRARRVPLWIHMWVHTDAFGDRKQAVCDILDRYPQDVQVDYINTPWEYNAPEDYPSYQYALRGATADKGAALDSKVVIPDWGMLDDIIADFPDPEFPRLFNKPLADDGRYRIGVWWFWMFERFWSLRGMTNALMDFYTNPKEVHRLFRAMTDFYLRVVERAHAERQLDGIFTSDDIGTQTGPFFSPQIFDEFFAPYYREVIEKAHSLGMHVWLHSCGNIRPFLPKFADLGLDVIHPIQKYTMDEKEVAASLGDRITFYAGFDVQQTIPWGTPDDVRREVRFMIDTYQRPEGRLVLGVGNGINEDCPVESLDALFSEAINYGRE